MLGCLFWSVLLLVLGSLGLVFFVTGAVVKLALLLVAIVLAVLARVIFFWWQ